MDLNDTGVSTSSTSTSSSSLSSSSSPSFKYLSTSVNEVNDNEVNVNEVKWLLILGLCCHGHGAYFALDPRKAHTYTEPEPSNQMCVMFYSKVALGRVYTQDHTNSNLQAAPLGFHSILGTATDYDEYIVYRYGQALPWLIITYQT